MGQGGATGGVIVDVGAGARFLWRTPAFLRRPITRNGAQAGLRRRREQRERGFLELVRRAVYGTAGSPYRALLDHAGCELGDLERLVRQDGVESALRSLFRVGVYLTVDEFKGRRPVVRGSLARSIDPAGFQNPRSAGHVPAQSGGSRSTGTAILMDLDFIREAAEDTRLLFDAWGGIEWTRAVWQVPGSGVIARLLEYAAFGAPPVRWFSQVDPEAPYIHSRYRWSAQLLRAAGWMAGRAFPRPEYVSVDASLPICRWMADVLAKGRTPHVHCYVSSATRLCHAARAAGLDLRGAQFMVVGEPLTVSHRAAMEATGASVVARYGIVECGVVGFGCRAAREPDEVHVIDDLHAVLQPDGDGGQALPPRSLLLSSLRPAAPLVLLNVSMGDEAIAESRSCGCPVEAIGWSQRLHTIRSYEKLTVAGMTVLDSDVIRLLEEVLPRRFGGAPTHYQLVEDHVGGPLPRLRLLVAPAVGPVDEAKVADAFLGAVSAGSDVAAVMASAWRDAGVLTIERRTPFLTGSGKILHLHVRR
jgi:hypothetical protein